MPIQIPTVQTGLEASIQAAAQKAGKNLKINLGTNSRSVEALSQPLGRITGKADEFTKSMEAANARVLAFGASVGVLSAITRGFRELVRTTIEVEKSLANINTILNVSAANLDKFKKEIFDVARNTEQTFDTVANAALELSRQGLKAEEVTKRLNDSMILARLSGLGAAEAVSGLTAAINSFNSEGLTSSEVLNKISAAAVKAAVSEKDLIEGIKRSGAVAIEAGVSFNELVGVISALQQNTARGGSVIGNSLKTIFTRLQSLEKLKTMQDLGVQITNAAGEVLPATKLIQNLGQAIQSLPDTRKLQIAEDLVGKFQIAPFLAILRDYNSETQVAIDITRVAANATTEAYGRNVTLNKTLSAAINEATVNLKELAETLGQIGVTESLQNVLGFFNSLVTKIQEVLEGEGIGSEFARGLVKGIGNVISGPGLAIFGAIIAKLTIDLTKFGAASLQTFFGLNKTAKDIAATQGSIASTLLKNSDIQKQILAIENSTLTVEQKRAAQTQFFTQALNAQLATMKQMQGIAASIAPSVVARTGGSTGRGRAAGGFIPNFDAVRGYGSEQQDIMRGVGGAPSSARPVTIPNFNFGGGQRGTMIANTSEFIVPNYAGGGSAIYNQDMVRSMGLPAGARSLAAGGYIPNFNKFLFGTAKGTDKQRAAGVLNTDIGKKYGGRTVQAADQERAKEWQKLNAMPAPKSAKTAVVAGGTKFQPLTVPRVVDVAKAFGARLPTVLTPTPGSGPVKITSELKQLFPELAANKKASLKGNFMFEGKGMLGVGGLGEFQKRFKPENVKKWAEGQVVPLAQKIAQVVERPPVNPSTIERVKGVKGYIGGIHAAMGGIFDAAVATGLNLASKDSDGGDFDYRQAGEVAEAKGWMEKLFGKNFAGSGIFQGLADLKFSRTGSNTSQSMRDKTIKEITKLGRARLDRLRAAAVGPDGRPAPLPAMGTPAGFKAGKAVKGAAGYIPNFDATRGYALEDAIAREKAAGLPISQIRVNQDARLRNAGNPMGLAVTNMRDEPTGSIAAAGGYVPSYARPAAGGAGGAGGADKLNQGFDSTLNKLFMFQIAMGVLTGFTSELSNENKTLAKSMKLLNLAVTAAMIGSMTKGGIGGMGRFFAGRAGSNMAAAGREEFGAARSLSREAGSRFGLAKGVRGAGLRGAGMAVGGTALAAAGPAVALLAAGQVFRMFQEPSKQAGKDLAALSTMAADAAASLSKMDKALSQEGAGTTGSGFFGSIGDFVQNSMGSLVQGISPFGSDKLITSTSRMTAGGERVDLELQGVSAEQFKATEIAVRQAFLAANPTMMGKDGKLMDAEQRSQEAQKFFEQNIIGENREGQMFSDDHLANARRMVKVLALHAKQKEKILPIEQIQEKLDKVALRDAQQRLSLQVQIKKAIEARTTPLQKQIQAAQKLGTLSKNEINVLEERNNLEKADLEFLQSQRDGIINLIKESENLVTSKQQEEAVRNVLNNLTQDELKDQVKLKTVLEDAVRLTNAEKIGGEKLVQLGKNMVASALRNVDAQSKIHDIKREQISDDALTIRQLQEQVDLANRLARSLALAAGAADFEVEFGLQKRASAREIRAARRTVGPSGVGAFEQSELALQGVADRRQQIDDDRKAARLRLQQALRTQGLSAIDTLGSGPEQTLLREQFQKSLQRRFDDNQTQGMGGALFDLQFGTTGLRQNFGNLPTLLQAQRTDPDTFNAVIAALSKETGISAQLIKDKFVPELEKAAQMAKHQGDTLEENADKGKKLADVDEERIRAGLKMVTMNQRLSAALQELPRILQDAQFAARTAPTAQGQRVLGARADKLQGVIGNQTLRELSNLAKEGNQKAAEKLAEVAAIQQGFRDSLQDTIDALDTEDMEKVNRDLTVEVAQLKVAFRDAITPSGRARAQFDLGVAQDMRAIARDDSLSDTQKRQRINEVRRGSINRGLGQTFAESSILNASDEERAQRVNELLRDGSVQFANNVGTAMHKAIRDGESFSDGLKNAGLAFLDYISEAMMQMAAQQVVGQFTSGMFGSGGTSQTGGATAGGGGGGFFSRLGSGGGGGGGNVTGAALVGGNFSSGGLITGGSGRRDDVPAMLTGGEFVMNRAAVADYGVGFMKQLNERRVQGFANGGSVGDLFSPSFSGRQLRGKNQLMGFAKQGVTSGSGDFIRGGSGGGGAFGVVSLQPGSIRGTQFQRRRDPVEIARTEARGNALGLFFRQLESEEQRQEAWEAEQQRLLEQRIRQAEMERRRREAEKRRREAEKRAKRSSIGSFIGMVAGSFVGAPFLGSIGGGAIGARLATGGYAQGGLFGLLGLGGLPSFQKMRADMEERGREAGYSPSNPAPRTRGGLLGGVIRQAAGVDTVPTMLSGGEFVMNAAATRRIGRSNLADLNSGVGGASGGSSSALLAAIGGLIGAQSRGDSGNNISITINQDGIQSTNMGGNTSQSAQSLASRIRDAVTEIIAEEKRLGGVLRRA